ncbi:hypothetical protein Tco_1007681 [Tanacetum coccineum]
MVYFVDGVLASGVEIILEMDFVRYAIQELEIHSFMIQIRILSTILQTFSTTLYSPKHTRVSYVGTILIMGLIVHHGYRLSMSRNRATIKILYSIDHQPQSIQEDLNQQRLNDECIKSYNEMIESRNELLKSLGEMLQEQVANLSTHTPEPLRRFNFIYDDDDDDEESNIPLNEIISQIPPSITITPVLPIMEPEDSLNMGGEHLSIIPKKESDKVIKSSVKDLVPIPCESKDTSENDSECDLPFCDDSFPLDVLGGNFVTFSNPLFDSNDDFTSSDDESFPEDIESKDSYVSNLDEHALLVTHLSELNEDECFDPGGDEIEACLISDSIPLGIDGADFDPEGDILLLEKLLNDDISFSLPPKEHHLYSSGF